MKLARSALEVQVSGVGDRGAPHLRSFDESIETGSPAGGDSRQRPSPGCEGSGSRKREADRGRSRSTEIPRRPLRPRSPPGPPPPRSNPEDRWVGPIPAYQREPPPRRDRSKERKNKGAKKRRQQALFSQFKAWGRNQDREDRRKSEVLMAPKRLLRPAAVLGPGVKAKAKANGRARGRGDQARLRRPA